MREHVRPRPKLESGGHADIAPEPEKGETDIEQDGRRRSPDPETASIRAPADRGIAGGVSKEPLPTQSPLRFGKIGALV
jgi:hypothetical protein